ncbi:MAG TPA: triple tyrosine motif-containing protein [Rhodothermales bacterium]
MVRGGDGRIWIATETGTIWLDPERIVRNELPPGVAIRSVTADGRLYRDPASLTLPAATSNIEIDYAALSFASPGQVGVRYMLEGFDRMWRDPGTRRQAFYTNLPPGQYRFHVIAANDDGVWNRAGAAINFDIPPTFVQSRWFFALCLALALLLLWSLHRLRLAHLASRIRIRLEARLGERERIARDLHDTLLQGIQGLIWRFQAAADHIPPEDPARQMLEESLDRADKLLGDSRDKVQDLRPVAGDFGELGQALATEGRYFSNLHPAKLKVSIQGARRDLHPIVREEGFLVSREALCNAFQHADADSIEVEVTYGDAALQVRVRDDGRGISDEVLDAGERPGHFGLAGMRERAKKLGAQLDVWSRPGAGTEVDLRIPAKVAYSQLATGSRGIRTWLGVFGFTQEHS